MSPRKPRRSGRARQAGREIGGSQSAVGGSFGAPLRFAWWGRVSTEDQQDPTLSLPRQLHNSRAALPHGAFIVSHFYDVESGRKDLELRGRGVAHEQFAIPIPRDGGIQDLLSEAQRPDRRFDAVICESIERVARRTYYGTKIEYDLESAGVALFAADEPIVLNGKRATTILTRRVKQGVAEWYVLELLEKSWDGACEHTRQGWNVGQPPYGYLAEKIPHPVPARRAEGRTKSRLVPDPVRAPVVHQIFMWRIVERLGYAAITERLNADLETYPSPVSPDPARRRDYWCRSAVRDLLHNPKYTGFMVWNRRATKKGGKVNPPDAWVWSAEPTHEPIVAREVFEAAAGVADHRKGSRNTAGTNARHPDARRSYPLRSFVVCELCERRMYGRTRRGNAYYVCEPKKNWGLEAARRFPDHPPTVYVSEKALLRGIFGFFGDRIFGANRRPLLEAEQRTLDGEPERKREARIEAVHRALAKLDARQSRLIQSLEREDDPGGLVFRGVRDRVAVLDQERSAIVDELRKLEADRHENQPGSVDLLDALPIGDADFVSLPEPVVRRLFEAFRLQVRYDSGTHVARCRVAISADSVDALREDVALAVRAPSGIRTRDLHLERVAS